MPLLMSFIVIDHELFTAHLFVDYYKKHRFAEYLSLYADENQAHRFRVRYFENFPFNIIYNLHLFIQKVVRNVKRLIKN